MASPEQISCLGAHRSGENRERIHALGGGYFKALHLTQFKSATGQQLLDDRWLPTAAPQNVKT